MSFIEFYTERHGSKKTYIDVGKIVYSGDTTLLIQRLVKKNGIYVFWPEEEDIHIDCIHRHCDALEGFVELDDGSGYMSDDGDSDYTPSEESSDCSENSLEEQ